jgi:type IV pilus assembly protein PilQ
MTFLQYLNGFGKKAAVTLIIISCIALAVFGQKTNPQTQGKHYGDPGFVGEAINLNVVNADVRDILNYITEQYGINFVIDKSVTKVPVTVNITDVPWNIALDAILSSQDLDVQVNGPILRIADSKTLAAEADIKAKIESAKLDSSPLYTEFIKLNYASTMGNQQGGGFTTGSPVSGGGGGGGAGGAGADGILPIVSKRLSRRGSVETDSRSNSLIITDVKENIDAIRQLVSILDQPEPQVEVEARVVIASRDFSRDIGVQLSGLVMGNQVGTNGKGQYNSSSSLISNVANSALQLTTGVFGTAQINLLLTAGENKGQAKTIATPRVTTLNNRKATVESGQQIPIVTSQTGANGGGVVFTTTYVSVPLKLEVTPRVSGDGIVVLDVVVENSSVSSTVSAGGTPGINTQRTQVNVMVPDGGTTVIGGAMVDVEGENLFRTPGLSKIPVIGNLFKRKAVARTTSEIIFFITPRISRPDFTSTTGKSGDAPRSTTILQPVPLGNPPSNSLPQNSDPTQQPVTIPTNPTAQPTPAGTIKP